MVNVPELLNKILKKGNLRSTRNANTLSIFSEELKFDVSERFPLLTTKKMFLRGIIEELLFFIRGETDSSKLSEKGVRIWEGNTSQEFLDKIKSDCEKKGIEKKLEIIFFQSNNEGEIIDKIHEVNDKFDGLIINPAAFTHSSIAILDSLRAINKPKIEIHLSNIYAREEYRKKSITSEGVQGLICGFGGNSYLLGIEAICKLIYK